MTDARPLRLVLSRSDWSIPVFDLAAKLPRFHYVGFARFQLTEVSKVLNHPLKLATFCSDGYAIASEHFIVAEKHSDGS